MDYSQPQDYHFSETSIRFVKFVSAYLNQMTFFPEKICDAYAGCGVVGLELRELLNCNIRVDFIEYHVEAFAKHLQVNSKWKENTGECYFMSLEQFTKTIDKKYDLIVANPPYFEVGRVKISTNIVKAKAHSFIDGSIEDYFALTQSCLGQSGYSFFLYPSSSQDQLKALANKYFLKYCLLENMNKKIGLFLLRHLNEKGSKSFA